MTQYMLLYLGASGSVPEHCDRGEFKQRLARAHGRSTPVEYIERDSEPDAQITIAEFGNVHTASGYMLEFVEKEDTHLPLVDMIQMDDRRTYQVPEEAVQSLPVTILNELEQREFVRLMGDYNPDTGAFSNVTHGWVDENKTAWDTLFEYIDALDGEKPALDYWAFEHGPDRWNVSAIADARGVEESTVRANIQTVDKELSRDTESVTHD